MKRKIINIKTKSVRYWLTASILLLFILLVAGVFYIKSRQTTYHSDTYYTMSSEEKKRVDIWLESHNLNMYGDPKGTAYTGGTPLFNEATGRYKNRYVHLIQRYPDRPWNK